MAKKIIEKQVSARDITNVAGNLINHGTLEIGTLILEGNNELSAELVKTEQEKLTLSLSTSYLEILKAQYSSKSLVERKFSKQIAEAIPAERQVLLTGEPGSGKTGILFQLSSTTKDPCYISVRNRSPLIIINHLINRIRIKEQKSLIVAKDIEEGLEMLQALLIGSSLVFLIDECETDADTVIRLMSLQKAGNIFVFATRNGKLFDISGISQIPIPPFDEEETRLFLSAAGINLDLLEFNSLFKASGGNPLYLFYFSKYQVSPLPPDLDAYHRLIWAGLKIQQQEIIAYIALSYRRLRMDDLSELLNDKSPMATTASINELASLLVNTDGKLQIFHPAFKEYTLTYLEKNGLIAAYRNQLGRFLLSKNRSVEAAWLLVDCDPKKIIKLGVVILAPILISGDLLFAEKLAQSFLTAKLSMTDTGFIEYQLANIHRLLNMPGGGEEHLEKAIVLFKKVRDKRWLLGAQMMKAITMVEEGRQQEGLALVDEIFSKSTKLDEEFNAQNLVNLTKIYIDLSEYRKAALAAKQAFAIFYKLDHRRGMISSLANLTSALAKLDDYKEPAQKYALQLVEFSSGESEFSVRLIALNILTSINRQNKDFTKAKKTGMEAVRLCQQYGLLDKMILNLINYGNVIRDEGDLTGAIKIYEEALVHANDLKLTKEKGRIYWILSSIYYELEDIDKSIEFSDLSIEASKSVNYTFGVAHACEEKAKALVKKGEKEAAANAYEESARLFLSIEHFSKDTRTNIAIATQLYYETGQFDKANELISLSITEAPGNNFEELNTVVNDVNQAGLPTTMHDGYRRLAQKYCNTGFEQNMIRKFMVYLDYCHQHPDTSKQSFVDVLLALANHGPSERYALTTLGILVEQSRELLDHSAVKSLINLSAKMLPGFNYRETSQETIMLATVTPVLKLEYRTLQDDLIALKLCYTAMLFMYAAPELVTSDKKPQATFYRATIADLRAVYNGVGANNIPKIAFKEHLQTLLIPDKTNRGNDLIYINTGYESLADLIKYPNNKCLMFFLGSNALQLTTHFYQEKKTERISTKPITRKLAYFFDYTNIEEVKDLTKEFSVNLDKLKKK